MLAVLAAVALALTAGSCLAFTVTTQDGYNKYDSTARGWGGEFQVYTTDWDGYADASKHKGGYPAGMAFATFCVQIEEHLSHGVPYDVSLSSSSAQVPGAVAWLYDQWYTGKLADYGYDAQNNNPQREDTGRAEDAYHLQRMIWKYMGYSGFNDPLSGKYAQWDSDASSHMTGGTIPDVQIMVLTQSGDPRQDLLVLTKAPNRSVRFRSRARSFYSASAP